tara:strand:- start:58 stop:681 length:624 start_codon:yes stop_codon:yes gene_type:complete
MDVIKGNNGRSCEKRCGALHLIMGPMYAGKSTKLIQTFNELDKSKDGQAKVVVITHAIENRYSLDKLSSHDRKEVDCTKVSDIKTIINACSNTISNDIQLADYILLDEAQFFPDLINTIELVETFHKTVYVYGLDGDFKRNKFGSILDLVPFCDTVQKLSGKCSHCDNKSHFSWRLSNDRTTQIVVGAASEYVSLCRQCYMNMQCNV